MQSAGIYYDRRKWRDFINLGNDGGVVEPNYIRSVSVCYRRSPSSFSQRSDVRSKSALGSPGSNLHRRENLLQRRDLVGCLFCDKSCDYVDEKCTILNEFNYLYGINMYQQFNFTKRSTIQLNQARKWIGNAWQCENEAFRQMYNSASRFPRRRTPLPTKFPSVHLSTKPSIKPTVSIS